ncbi:MAG: hypothetical protein M3Q77_05325 [Thermoproteota archaeon]|nr:hypothetical protein [Thermoproteota archaeon]
MSSDNQANLILDLYKIYDSHRDSRLWFLDELNANSYKEYHEKYYGTSKERSHFIAVCGFFELSGTLISHGLIAPDIYFDIFNPSPFWHKAKSIVEGMRETRPQIYENFENLSEKRSNWKKKNQKI